MNEQEFQAWRKKVKIVYYSKIYLDDLKKQKKIGKKKYDKINLKIKKLRIKTFLNSPHFEGREELKKKARNLCLKDYCSSIFSTI